MIFVDSNIPMYLVGADEAMRTATRARLREIVASGRRLVTSAEVLQEILHRYRAIGRPDAIQRAFDVLLGIVEEVFPVDPADVERAKEILLARWSLSARDALHVAVMQRRGVVEILSFDGGFDEVPGLTRLS